MSQIKYGVPGIPSIPQRGNRPQQTFFAPTITGGTLCALGLPTKSRKTMRSQDRAGKPPKKLSMVSQEFQEFRIARIASLTR